MTICLTVLSGREAILSLGLLPLVWTDLLLGCSLSLRARH